MEHEAGIEWIVGGLGISDVCGVRSFCDWLGDIGLDLVAIDARELFPQVTTWIGFPRDMVLRGYMVDFIHLFAPHYAPRLIRDTARAQSQEEVDALFKSPELFNSPFFAP